MSEDGQLASFIVICVVFVLFAWKFVFKAKARKTVEKPKQ